MAKNESDWLTEVELAVDFLTVDDVELVWNACIHVADLEVEPLVVVIGVDVTVKDQVILIVTNLQRQHDNNNNKNNNNNNNSASPCSTKETTYSFQRLSMALQKNNALSFQNIAPIIIE